MSALEETLATYIRYAKLPVPEREYKFHELRRWRFDFAWPAVKLAAEVEGGTWTQGRHTRGAGFADDCEKYNAAVIAGWRVLRFPAELVKNGEVLLTIEKALAMTHGRRG